ncbi:MAG: RnfABCDGE type electron transport complex subunit D [Pseudomonadota bacterium]
MRGQISTIFADPRHGQICALSCLILLGMAVFAFEMPWWRPATAVVVALSVQAALGWAMGWRFDWRSPLITSLSLTLLFRSEGPDLVALAAGLAIASKTVLRIDGRHFVNPAAFAIVSLVLLFDGAWVSPGQWGAEGWAVIFAVGAGVAVTHGAHRLEVPLTFLVAWAVLSFGRALWLGDPMAIPMHQMSSGALVVFAFFMISDPMTAPWHPVARAVWVCLAAVIGFALQMSWIVTAGPLFGLVAVCWLVPILNRWFPAPRHRWRPIPFASPKKEQIHA